MTGLFTPQPYLLRLVEFCDGRAVRAGMVIGWSSGDADRWTPVVAFDGETAATEASAPDGCVWEFQIPAEVPVPRVRTATAPPAMAQGERGEASAGDVVLRLLDEPEPPRRTKAGRESSLRSPLK